MHHKYNMDITHFDSYISISEAIEGVNAGVLHRGVLRVPAKSPSDAYVSFTSGERDCRITGAWNRNRAIHGDAVVFKFIGTSMRDVKPSNAANTPIGDSPSGEVDGSSEMQPEGKVMYIEKYGGTKRVYCARINNQLSGITADSPLPCNIIVTPLNPRIPNILITKKNCEEKGINLYEVKPEELYAIQITEWAEASLHPNGEMVDVIGTANVLEDEEKRCLIEFSLDQHMKPFSLDAINEADEIQRNLKKEFEKEIKNRVDLRDCFTLSVDPPTTRDFDDVIHMRSFRQNKKQLIEVGVSIADVSHYVKAGSCIDEEARSRCTTVYMPSKAYPMLPRQLCEDVCSLRRGVDALTFTVVYTMNTDGYLEESCPPKFFKSVIRKDVELSYQQLQTIVDSYKKSGVDSIEIKKYNLTNEAIKMIDTLYSLTARMRKTRISNGSLTFKRRPLQFITKNQKCVEVTLSEEEAEGAKQMIEELMLMANLLVSHKLLNSPLSEIAVLRRCPPIDVNSNQILKLKDLFRRLRLPFDFTSSKTMQKSSQHMMYKYGPQFSRAVELLIRGQMCKAEYFVAEDEEDKHHFPLNFNCYTHFTSPIRRYADVMVHRLLYEVILEGDKNIPRYRSIDTKLQCMLCNEKRDATHGAKIDCDWSYFINYLTSLNRLLITTGVVVGIGRSYIDVMIPSLEKKAKLQVKNKGCETTYLHDTSKKRLKFPTAVIVLNSFMVMIKWKGLNDVEATQYLTLFSSFPVFVLASSITLKDLFVCIVPHDDLLFNRPQGSSIDAVTLGSIDNRRFRIPKYIGEVKWREEVDLCT